MKTTNAKTQATLTIQEIEAAAESTNRAVTEIYYNIRGGLQSHVPAAVRQCDAWTEEREQRARQAAEQLERLTDKRHAITVTGTDGVKTIVLEQEKADFIQDFCEWCLEISKQYNEAHGNSLTPLDAYATILDCYHVKVYDTEGSRTIERSRFDFLLCPYFDDDALRSLTIRTAEDE